MNWFFWALLSAIFAAATAVTAKMGLAGIDSSLATALRTTVVFLFTWAVALATVRPVEITAVTRQQFLFLGLSGAATALSWLCYFRALQLGTVSKVAPIDKLSVPLAIALAWVFLGERLGPRELAGAAAIIGGTLLLIK